MTSRPEIAPEQGFVEVADRCWVARYEYLDVNVGVVAGDRGLLLVDTHSSPEHARTVLEQVRRLAAGDVVAVVNTHAHFDHCFGNGTVLSAYGGAQVLAHEAAAPLLPEDGPASDTFSSALAVDLGDRLVELFHPGRGHTDGDLVVRVPDADTVFAGDLVEESALRNGVPGFGEDCFPLEWPATLELLVTMLGDGTVVVPGHGLPVDKDFVMHQRGSIGVVAETIRDLASRGVPLDEALGATEWPYPVEELGHAVARGYAQLPRTARSLPLL